MITNIFIMSLSYTAELVVQVKFSKKRFIMKIWCVILILTYLVSFSGCNQNKTIAPYLNKPEKVLNIWVSSEFFYEADQKRPPDEWIITQLCNQFEAQHSGVRIELTLVHDSSAAHDTFKVAALAKAGPDIANLWAGQPLFALKDVLLDITNYIPADDLAHIVGWDSVTLDFEDGNPILAYPICGLDICGFIYNKELVSKAGLDFEGNPPKNPEEFISSLEKIKTMGIIPITADEQGYNSLYTKSFASWWVQMVGKERIASNSYGSTKFIDDKYFISSIKMVNEIFSRGLVNADYASSQNSVSAFLRGNAALLGGIGLSTVSIIADKMGYDNIGFYTVPDFKEDAPIKNTTIGGLGQVLAINKNTKHPELAVEFCSFIDNKKNQLALINVFPQLPLRNDISISDLGWDNNDLLKKIYKLGKNYVYWSDNSMLPEIANECYSLGTLAVTGKITAEQFAEKLDMKATSLAKQVAP